MEITEQSLEKLIKKERALIESKIAALNPTEIAIASNKIPATLTMLEYRDIRNDFIHQFEKPFPMSEVVTFSEQLLSRARKILKFPSDQRKLLIDFFQKEIDRVKEISDIVSSRISSPGLAFKNQNEYSVFLAAVSEHSTSCEEGMERLAARTLMTFNANDLQFQIIANFLESRRNAMFKAYRDAISMFPLTKRKSIFNNLFTDLHKKLLKDTSASAVQLQIVDEAALDKELIRLAHRFNITPDLETDDGQKFVYFANKTFESMFCQLNNHEFPKKNYPIPDLMIHPSQIELTQLTLFVNFPREYRLQSLTDQILSIRDLELSANIREISQYYNTSIKSQLRKKNAKPIPSHKVAAWLELRFTNIKFMMCGIISLLNYFEYVKYKVAYPKGAANLKLSHAPSLLELLEISDEKGPFLFQTTMEHFDEIKDRVIAVGSFYLEKLQLQEGQTPDRENLLERILQYEFRILNAKRRIVQVLLESLEHGKCEKIVRMIHEIIQEVPILNLPAFKSFDVPYESAIELIEKRGTTLRLLFNLQIHHERQIATQFPNYIKIFDRPLHFNAQQTRQFDESVPISPFEVYKSLNSIHKFIELVPFVVNEMGEAADIKMGRFKSFLEIAVIKEIEQLLKSTVQQGFFPYDRPSENFQFLLSDSVSSLFSSPYTNSLTSIFSLMSSMNEGRKVRFLLSAQKFIKITMKLQKSLIRTNQLQIAYFSQCELLGISERTVLLSPFKDILVNEHLDMHPTSINDKLLDFAINEFEPTIINFLSATNVKDIIIMGNYDKLNEVLRFQNLQNVILEIALRYNSHVLDSDFFVDFFDLDERNEKDNTTLFLTAAKDVENEEREQRQNQSFFKQFIAAQLFNNSTTLFRDNQAAFENKHIFMVPIKTLKSRARAYLAGQYKNKSINPKELIETYINEMIDCFSCYIYRSEIVHVTNLERQILLASSFIDTYVLGPDPASCLINEAGRFEKFFYVPTWTECFEMMQTAPQQRQSTVLKPTLQFIIYRFQILSLTRFEISMQMPASQVFLNLYDNEFPLETLLFQKLYNEFQRLPSAREVDVSANYMKDRMTYFFHRFEQTVITAIESFFVSLSVEGGRALSHNVNTKSTSMLTNVTNRTGNNAKKFSYGSKMANFESIKKSDASIRIRMGGVTDPLFGDTMKSFWVQLHQPLDNHLITVRRYIHLFQDEFIYNINESDRMEMANTFLYTDQMIEEANVAMRQDEFTDVFQMLPLLLDFLKNSVSMEQMKFAYYLLLQSENENDINIASCILRMNQTIYVEGEPTWNNIIESKARKNYHPREDQKKKHQDGPPINILHELCIEQIKNQIDLLLLSNQIKAIKKSTHKFSNEFSSHGEYTSEMFKPETDFNKNVLDNPLRKQPLLIDPKDADQQFNKENLYSRIRFVEIVANGLNSCAIRKNGNDTVIYSGDNFEDLCQKLTTFLELFSSSSLNDMNMTWRQYIATVDADLRKNTETLYLIDRLAQFIRDRFQRHVESEISSKLPEQICEVNALNDQLHSQSQAQILIDHEIAHNLTGYFDNLVEDLNNEIKNKKSMFSGIKQSVFQRVLNKIEAAKNVKLEAVAKPNLEDGEDTQSTNSNDQIIQSINEKNEKTRKKILQLRVVRTLIKIAVTRYYQKKLNTVENDRKHANSMLWSNKLQYETQELTMRSQLDEAQKRFAATEIEVERLKQQLENEKTTNSQLVHWKAINSKSVDELKKKILSIKNVGDVNIDRLLEKLQERQQELDVLREENNEMNKNIEETVRKPMKDIDKLRNELIKTRAEKSEMILSLKNDEDFNERLEREMKDQSILDENVRLKNSNKLLKMQIEEIESLKEKKARDVKSFMEKTTQPAPPALRNTSKLGTIVKPNVMGRSLSRI